MNQGLSVIRLIIESEESLSFLRDVKTVETTLLHEKNSPRISRSGKKIGGIYNSNKWSGRLFRISTNSINEDILINALRKVDLIKTEIQSNKVIISRFDLIIDLSGNYNMTVIIDEHILSIISDLGVSLSMEVFPDWLE